jgi:hypothetical protein
MRARPLFLSVLTPGPATRTASPVVTARAEAGTTEAIADGSGRSTCAASRDVRFTVSGAANGAWLSDARVSMDLTHSSVGTRQPC